MLLGVPSITADLGRTGAADAAQAKLLSALPVPLRESVRLWQDRILGCRKISFAYRGRDRVVDPLGLVIKAGIGIWWRISTDTLCRFGSVEWPGGGDRGSVRPDEGFLLEEVVGGIDGEFDRSLLRFG